MIEINKCKLVPGLAATWGEVTGNIENQADLVSYISTHGGGNAEWGSISGNLSDQTDLMGYMDSFATTAWVSEQNYLTSASLTGYATQAWVSSQGYLVSDDLSQYATRQWVTGRGYATQSWVESQGYITSSSLSGYIHFDESSPLSSIGKTLPFYSSTVGLFPVYQSFSSAWVNIEMTTNEIGWVSMGLACYDETGSSEIWRDRFITENDMTGYVSRSYVDWSMQTQGYPFDVYTLADVGGNYILGSLNDTTQAFTGIKVSGSQAGAYTVISSGLQYQESFSPFATQSWVDNNDYANEEDVHDWIFDATVDCVKWTEGPGFDCIDGGNLFGLGYVDQGTTKLITYIEAGELFWKQLEYIEDEGEMVLDRELSGPYYQQWPGYYPLETTAIQGNPDYDNPPEGYPLDVYIDAPFTTFGYCDIGETWRFDGVRLGEEGAGIYTITPVEVEDEGETVIEYQEEYKAFALDEDLTTLASRVTSLETNYGDAVTITNNILGV